MDATQIETLENELRKNTEILDSTFEQYNLKILSVAYSASLPDGDDVKTWLEMIAIEGNKLQLPKSVMISCLEVKINFYKNDRLLCSAATAIFPDKFNGYDTKEIHISQCGLISQATKVRIFATLG